MVVCCFSAYAGEPEKIETLSTKVIMQSTNGYFLFSDGSCWKVMNFQKRWRSPGEWWNNIQLVPQNYECLPNDWVLGSEIAIYPKYQNMEVNLDNASNLEALKQCTHLLFNRRTGQVLFATSLHPSECITQVFNDANKEGYETGYNKGRLASYQNSAEVYEQGHKDGYKKGYTEGYRACLHEESEIR